MSFNFRFDPKQTLGGAPCLQGIGNQRRPDSAPEGKRFDAQSTQGVSDGSSRANHASGDLPVAGEQTFVLMAAAVACTSRPVGASTHAIRGSVLTLHACHRFRRGVEERCGADEGDREQ
jgi:hypothetical protein